MLPKHSKALLRALGASSPHGLLSVVCRLHDTLLTLAVIMLQKLYSIYFRTRRVF